MRALLIDYQGRMIRFPEERWEHIVGQHSEMAQMEETIGATLLDPDEIYWDPQYPGEVQLYYRWFTGLPVGDVRICVTIRVFESDAFVMTAHVASHPKGNDLIWTRTSS